MDRGGGVLMGAISVTSPTCVDLQRVWTSRECFPSNGEDGEFYSIETPLFFRTGFFASVGAGDKPAFYLRQGGGDKPAPVLQRLFPAFGKKGRLFLP